MPHPFSFPAPLRGVPDSGDTFSYAGLAFRFTPERDDDPSAPWEREDGHGPVSDWTSVRAWWSDAGTIYRPKRAGSMVLCRDHNFARFYDFAEAMQTAKRDGWGLSDDSTAALANKLGREPTLGEIREVAVHADFERMRDWCEDRWQCVCVGVTLLDVDGLPTDEVEYLGGVESDSGEYITNVATDLADTIMRRVADATVIPARPASFTIRRSPEGGVVSR